MTDIDSDVVDDNPNDQSDAADSTDQSPSQDHGNTDGTTRFQTYEEPDLDNPAIDVDVDATNQFIEDFLVIDHSEDKNKRVPQDKVFDVFSKWAKINNIDLIEISEDKIKNKRKGNLKTILLDLTEVDTGRPTIDEERTRVYYSTELSELGNELYQSDI
jgi:hypothetical protein